VKNGEKTHSETRMTLLPVSIIVFEWVVVVVLGGASREKEMYINFSRFVVLV